MASNRISESYEGIVQSLEDAADGADDVGPTIPLKQNDGPALRGKLVALVGRPAGPGNVPPAEPGLKNLWNTAKANKVSKTAAAKSARSTGRALAMACVSVLKPRLGNQWNSAWNSAGFTQGSLQVPPNPLTYLQQLRNYFQNSPTHEVPNLTPTISCTAAECHAKAEAISTAATASNQSNTDAGTAKAAYEAALDEARRALTGLREELTQNISDDDPRWYAFGFVRPIDPEVPEVPEDLVVTLGAAGSKTTYWDWDDAPRADNYRLRITNPATSEEVFNDLFSDSDATVTLSALASGTALQAVVTGRTTEGGESQPSAPVNFTLP
jgi:hypothetical protein